MRTVQVQYWTNHDTMNHFIGYLSVSETVDEFNSFVEIMLSSPEMSQLTYLYIYSPIPERSLVFFNYLLGTLQNIKHFSVNDTLNAMLPAHCTILSLEHFYHHVPAVWYKLSNLTQLTELSICDGDFDETDCEHLIQLLGNNQRLEELIISKIRIHPYKMESLIKIIGNLSRIQSLTINNFMRWWLKIDLGKSRSKLILEPLKRLQSLKVLDIDQIWVPIDFNSVMSIIQNFYQLKSLYLRNFRLSESHIANLMTLLRYRPLVVLRLYSSPFSLKGLTKLVSEAGCNPQLESIFIDRCLFIEGLTQATDQFSATFFKRPKEAIEADKQIALDIAQSCAKIRFEILFN